MYTHGIYVVYTWIFLDIPSFLKPDFAAGPCCWSHSMRIRVLVIKSVYCMSHHGNCAKGKGCPGPQKAQPDCSQPSKSPSVACCSGASAVTAAAAAVSLASFHFPSLVAGKRLESWWKMGPREPSGQVTNVLNILDACLHWKSRRRKNSICKGGGSSMVASAGWTNRDSASPQFRRNWGAYNIIAFLTFWLNYIMFYNVL